MWRYPCMIVGYVRLGLLALALLVSFWAEGDWRLKIGVGCIIALSYSLDLLDGYLARKYNQVTHVGSLFDLTIDLTTHTVVWLRSGFYLAGLLVVLEWSTGLFIAAVSSRPESHWKSNFTTARPRLIQAYFQRGQHNWLSAYGNIAHGLFPLVWYLGLTHPIFYLLVTPGALLYEIVTIYMLYAMAQVLAEESSS